MQLVAQVGALEAALLPGAAGGLAEGDGAPGAQAAVAEGAAAAHRLVVALPAADHEAALGAAAEGEVGVEALLLEALGAGELERDAGLLLVGEAQDVGLLAVLGELADDLAAGDPVRGHPALVAALLGDRADAAGDLGDHAERPLGAQHQLAQGRPSGRVGRLEGPEGPGWSGQLDRGDELVEAPVSARGLAGGAGGRHAADGRLLEGLREVADRVAEAAEGRLGLGAAQARAEPGGERGAVEVDGAQRGHVEGDDGRVARRRRRRGLRRRWSRRRRGRPRRRPRRTRRAAPRPTRSRRRRSRRREPPRASRCAAGRGRGSCGPRRGGCGRRRRSARPPPRPRP